MMNEVIHLLGYEGPKTLELTRGFDLDPKTNRRLVGIWDKNEVRIFIEVVAGDFWYNATIHLVFNDVAGLSGIYCNADLVELSQNAELVELNQPPMVAAAAKITTKPTMPKRHKIKTRTTTGHFKLASLVKVVEIKDRRKLALDKDI